jgi:hypothetical protein
MHAVEWHVICFTHMRLPLTSHILDSRPVEGCTTCYADDCVQKTFVCAAVEGICEAQVLQLSEL